MSRPAGGRRSRLRALPPRAPPGCAATFPPRRVREARRRGPETGCGPPSQGRARAAPSRPPPARAVAVARQRPDRTAGSGSKDLACEAPQAEVGFLERRARHRLAEQVALHLVAPEGAQAGRLSLGLDAL